MDKLLAIAEEDWHGLCFVNLVEFDMVYGHRNDAVGYAQALNRFDQRLGDLLPLLHENDVLMITADHGCDPATPSTDHSREYVPLLVWGHLIPPGLATGTRATFADAGATVTALLGVATRTAGKKSVLIDSALIPHRKKRNTRPASNSERCCWFWQNLTLVRRSR